MNAIVKRRALPAHPNGDAAPGDRRFHALIADEDWQALPPGVQERFSKPPAAFTVYAGEVVTTHLSKAGWLLAHAARLIGGPFPLCDDVPALAVVSVADDPANGAQTWTRIYGRRRNGTPQVMHSAKFFTGPTGLEEHIGGGVGMALRLSVEGGALVFRSVFYFIDVLGLRIVLPSWLSPGTLTATHREVGGGKFSFSLGLMHRRFGQLIQQTVIFRELAR